MKGKFRPLKPEKYIGNKNEIFYRSSWEFLKFSELDKDDRVEEWASEPFPIKYKSPVDGKYHSYWPDIFVKYKDGSKFLYEIKPEKETKPPEPSKKKTKRYLKEVITWGINEQKFLAATKYCEDKGWIFRILTEKELGIKK